MYISREIKNNSVKNVRKIDKKLTNFLDHVDDVERDKINEALVELFIVFNIKFDQIKSSYVKDLMQLLRPSYAS